jgi:hypothetical protein
MLSAAMTLAHTVLNAARGAGPRTSPLRMQLSVLPFSVFHLLDSHTASDQAAALLVRRWITGLAERNKYSRSTKIVSAYGTERPIPVLFLNKSDWEKGDNL